MEHRAVYEGELELRQSGRRLGGRFPYSQKAGDRMATVMNKGRVRKERIGPDAFGWQIREFQKLQDELAQVIDGAVDEGAGAGAPPGDRTPQYSRPGRA